MIGNLIKQYLLIRNLRYTPQNYIYYLYTPTENL